ncbi:unnamed protein product [Zymoseptoria tritici ST99CH_1A5]|nr:unnamed protein product [Zymoseptoria tritici ST99CH_1A5]
MTRDRYVAVLIAESANDSGFFDTTETKMTHDDSTRADQSVWKRLAFAEEALPPRRKIVATRIPVASSSWIAARPRHDSRQTSLISRRAARNRSCPRISNIKTTTSPSRTNIIPISFSSAALTPASKFQLTKSDPDPAASTTPAHTCLSSTLTKQQSRGNNLASPPPSTTTIHSPFLLQSPCIHIHVPPTLNRHARTSASSSPCAIHHDQRACTVSDKRSSNNKTPLKDQDHTPQLARQRTFPLTPLRSRENPSTSRTADSRTARLSHSKSHSLAVLNMARSSPLFPPTHDDIFLELANDSMTTRDDSISFSHSRSFADKRRATPADAPRPSTSGSIYARPSSRLHTSRASADLMRQGSHFRSPSQQGENHNAFAREQDARARRHTELPAHSPLSPSRLARRTHSPTTSVYGRRQSSIGGATATGQQRHNGPFTSRMYDSPDESANEETAPKGPESTSAQSDGAETVWDELDELKSRIKRLELTGKPAATSSAAVSGGSSSDRPRTATTAPTTINSSPKQERKKERESVKETSIASPEDVTNTPSGSNIHPLLHQALAKAKPLLNPTLYRSLDATAADALQLAAMTGSAGPHGTTYSAASFMTGMGSSDRHVRRKADNMCRNLTDLCLALCEGKHEASRTLVSQPSMESVAQRSPSVLHSRQTLRPGPSNNVRPMSRLEARRSSIFGTSPTSDSSPRVSLGESSPLDQDATMTQNFYRKRGPRTSLGSGLARRRTQQLDDVSGTDEEEPTIRPVSRATTEVNGFRTRPRFASDHRSTAPAPLRSPALREVMATQRSNEDAYGSNRVASYGSEQRMGSEHRLRRSFQEQQFAPATPEEEESELTDFHPISRPPQRVTSLGRFSSRRAATEKQAQGQGYSPGLQQRRHVIVE